MACAGNTQIGNYVPTSGFNGRAIVWNGTPESAQDLHQPVLDQLGSQYVRTETTGIDAVTGDIVGIAYTLNGFFEVPHAIMWRPVAPPCEADLNGDHVVDIGDLTALLSHFGTASGATHEDGDMDADGDIDLVDLATLLASFGVPCP